LIFEADQIICDTLGGLQSVTWSFCFKTDVNALWRRCHVCFYLFNTLFTINIKFRRLNVLKEHLLEHTVNQKAGHKCGIKVSHIIWKAPFHLSFTRIEGINCSRKFLERKLKKFCFFLLQFVTKNQDLTQLKINRKICH